MRTKNTPLSSPVGRRTPRAVAGGPGRPVAPATGFGVAVDGAVGYSLRLIPSNKVLGRYRSTKEAWPAVVAAIDGGRSPRTLVLDWQAADGSQTRLSAGVTLEYLARRALGMPAEHLRPRTD
jgi:hypothetical protein